MLLEQLEHPQPHFAEESRDPPVDEQGPGEVAGFVEPVRVDQVARGGAEVRQLQPELRDGVGLPGTAQLGGEPMHEAEVVVGVRDAHQLGLAALLEAPDRVLAHDRQ